MLAVQEAPVSQEQNSPLAEEAAVAEIFATHEFESSPHFGLGIDSVESSPWADHKVERAAAAAPSTLSSTPSTQPQLELPVAAPVSDAYDGSLEGACVGGSACVTDDPLPPLPPAVPSPPTEPEVVGGRHGRIPSLQIQTPVVFDPEDRVLGSFDGCSSGSGEVTEGRDSNDDDADEYLSCVTGTPSPEVNMSPVPCEGGEVDGQSLLKVEEQGFDDFSSCVDEGELSELGDSFEAFASGPVTTSFGGELLDYTTIFDCLSVAEVDFEGLAKEVLMLAFSFDDLPPERTLCPAGPSNAEYLGDNCQSSDHYRSASNRLGGDGCVALWEHFTAVPLSVNPGQEGQATFEWKSSLICRLFLAAANTSFHREYRQFSPSLASEVNSDRGSFAVPSRVGTEAGLRAEESAGMQTSCPPSPMRVSSRRGAKSAADTLSELSKARHLDLRHVQRLCSVSKAGLMKRSVKELSVLRDHYAEVSEHAISHLRFCLDNREQAAMLSEMNHKVIENLVLRAQKDVSEKSAQLNDAKRKSGKTIKKPPNPQIVEDVKKGVAFPISLVR